ncbi:alkene reductase [Mycobacterium sp. 134]|uniref:alkene reductase n=1 Tax=Mycobacterium sp. 134 TaxID=3400425 RepID=UPI003AAC2596
MNAILSGPIRLGVIEATNRIVMAPMTRSRAGADGVPRQSTAAYYAQRASAGLVVSEGICIAPEAVGNPMVPGLWSREQIGAWRSVTSAVHDAGGMMAAQLWHTGRASHPSLQPDGQLPVGPSPIAIDGLTFAANGRTPYVTPRALDTGEIPQIVDHYARAAANAREAGFDAVELHSANGYLVDQFLQDNSNRRGDRYGGSIENRVRLLVEIVVALVDTVGPGRVGVRISPASTFQDMADSDPHRLFDHVVRVLSEHDLAYLHVVEPGIDGWCDAHFEQASPIDSEWIRARYAGNIVATGGYTAESATRAVESGIVDAVAFGRSFIANPDLPRRLIENLPIAEPNRETFYSGGDEGYIDYPFWDESTVSA